MTELLGHLHPVLVHLPIGILLLACFLQLLTVHKNYRDLQPAISLSLFWGMLSAIGSCITGYLLSGSGDYDEDLVGKHQWLGISVALVSILYYFLYRYRVIVKYTWVLPVVLMLLVGVTGHLGGSLTHGSDYLSSGFKHFTTGDTAVVKKVIPDVQQAFVYADIIQPLLQDKCYSCHGEAKQKGKLRMDLPDLLMKGGKEGVVIEAGKPDESELLKRIILEKADEHHMPPKEKPQLTEKDIALLHWWIASGASFTKKTRELDQPEKIKPMLLSLQNTATEKKNIADVPGRPVEKANESAIKKLTDRGVVVMPVSVTSNYLMVSFVAASNIGDTAASLLLPLKNQLVWLTLSDTHITDSALKIVGQCTQLTKLELNNTAVTDRGLSSLVALHELQLLNLAGTKISAAGLLQLKTLQQLRTLYFYHSAIQNTDWANLQKAFPKAVLDSGGYKVPLLATDTQLAKPPKINQ